MGIKRICGFIEKNIGWIAIDHPCDQEALFLTTAQPIAVPAYNGLVAEGHGLDEMVHIDQLCDLLQASFVLD
ncbi:hypothetical protein D3C85_1539620 [compost metagenome]